MQHRPLFLAAACRLVVLGSTSAAAPAAHVQCSVLGPGTLHFCSGVTWNASLPLPASSLDKAAKADFELALDRLHRLGSTTSLPMCLESWKALQCASKFQKCSSEQPAQKVCRTLCTQFAATCNGSEAVLARCNDELLYDDPPCTDYAELPSWRGGPTRWMAESNVPQPLDLVLPSSGEGLVAVRISSSPIELFQTAAGLPLLLTLGVLLLHAACCVLQLSCGATDDEDPAEGRRALHSSIAGGGRKGSG